MVDLDPSRVSAVLLPRVPDGSHRYFLDDHCGNCAQPLTHWGSKLFCDGWCSSTAETVRYARRVVSDGRGEQDPLVFEAIKTRLAFALIGGYQSLGRQVKPEVRTAVKDRDGGKCVRCGRPGTDIDHISGNDNSPANLQLLCAECHREKTAEAMRPAGGIERVLLMVVWAKRILTDEPLVLADADEWRTLSRQLKANRNARLAKVVDALGIPGVSRMSQKARAELLAEASRDGLI